MYWIIDLFIIYNSRFEFCSTQVRKVSSNPGKLHSEGLVHLLRYIRDNDTLGVRYFTNMNDAPVSDLLIQDSINTENKLMDLSDSNCKYFPDTGISTGEYIIFYQGGPIDHATHVTVTVAQSGAEIEYNAVCTAGITLANFRMSIHELLNKNPDIVPEAAPLIIFDIKSAVCMAKNGKDTKHKRKIARRVNFVRNGENCKMHKIEWCEGGLQ